MISDANHALLVGEVIGCLLAGRMDAAPLTDDEGNYTNQISVVRPSGIYLITVDKEKVA